jgi:hypothetical protein
MYNICAMENPDRVTFLFFFSLAREEPGVKRRGGGGRGEGKLLIQIYRVCHFTLSCLPRTPAHSSKSFGNRVVQCTP